MAEMPQAEDDIVIPEEAPAAEQPPVEGAGEQEQPQAAEGSGIVPADEQEPMEVLEPRLEPIKRTLGIGGMEMELWQKPLSFMGRWEFFALVGDAITKLMDAEEGVTLAQLMQSIGVAPGQTIEDQMKQVEVILKGFARLTKVAPNLLDECFVVWLNVPAAQREHARQLMRLPADEGGFDDDDGWDIIEAFIEQNAEEIIAFFTERLPGLLQTGTQLRQFADHRRSSRRSRRGQRRDASR